MSLLLTVYFFTKVCTFFCLYHLNEFSLNHFILNGSSCSLDTCRLKSKINTNYSANQTSPLVFTCTGSYPGNLIGLSVTVFQILVPLPMHTWVLWLGTSDIRNGGNLASSDIFTVNLSLLELMTVLVFLFMLVAFTHNYQHTLILAMFFSGSYLVGRPIMNCLICVERHRGSCGLMKIIKAIKQKLLQNIALHKITDSILDPMPS